MSVYAAASYTNLIPSSTVINGGYKYAFLPNEFGIDLNCTALDPVYFSFGVGFKYLQNEMWSDSFISGYVSLNPNNPHAVEGDNVSFLYTHLYDFTQTNRAYYLTMPLKAQYNWHFKHGWNLFVATGIKLGIPLASTAKITTNLDLPNSTVYFPYSNNEIPLEEVLTDFNLNPNDFRELTGKQKLHFGVNLDWFLECGVEYKLPNDKGAIMLSAFFDLGVLNLQRRSAKRHSVVEVDYRSSDLLYIAGGFINGKTDEYFNPSPTTDFQNTVNTNNYIDKIHAVSGGIKLSYRLPDFWGK
ncbi:hypothetical protein FACS1894178_7860 [Bacteroidia bacterium]|nr:hypothetical protein FACS1894178_7860 [Bacteroidia bacterium]